MIHNTYLQGWKSIVKSREESIFDKRKVENNTINYQLIVLALGLEIGS